MNPSSEFNRFGGASANMKGKRTLTIVIKLGTSSICDEKTHEPLLSNLSLLVETAVRLRRDGHRVILVSSGAIGIGLRRLDIEKRPKHLAAAQAIAAVGQCRLIALWDELFKQLRQPVAQILLTRNDIADRTQYLNASNTFAELLSMGIIPIVNENDTLAVNEIKFGDNDTLSAITAGMVNADYLFLMTDVDCLYTNNPRTHPDAQPIEIVADISTLEVDVSSAGSTLGTGGMATKLTAARLATSAGVTTIITRSSIPSNISHIVAYIQSLKETDTNSQPATPSLTKTSPTLTSTTINTIDDPITFSPLSTTRLSTPALTRSPTPQPTTTTTASSLPHPLHTRFLPKPRALRDRYFWILHGLAPHGTIFIDEGAYRALTRRDKAGLLPVGVVDVTGSFAQQEAVNLAVVQRTPDAVGGGYEVKGPAVGKALVNYSSAEIARIMGQQSSRIQELLGYADSEYIAYRDNTAFFDRKVEEQHQQQQ
ncbi:glutamate 5-kinase [Choiromyces venosus 120613-1]|uniref:Glutamate 5-kinase n=1 Tax=Choiromyces venosus 120613-1 TaxID=1336337 RepID=A0A3N4JCP9_9PEZI|nr:glutamate 5-kinase [Choiromyces venosus 120613-1]